MMGDKSLLCSTALRLLFDCASTKGPPSRSAVEAESKKCRTLLEHFSNNSRRDLEALSKRSRTFLEERSIPEIAVQVDYKSGNDYTKGNLKMVSQRRKDAIIRPKTNNHKYSVILCVLASLREIISLKISIFKNQIINCKCLGCFYS